MELCIQSRMTKPTDNINPNKIALKSNKALDEFDLTETKYSDGSSNTCNDTSEVDGIKKEEIESKHKSMLKINETAKHGKKEEVYRRQRDPDAMIDRFVRPTNSNFSTADRSDTRTRFKCNETEYFKRHVE